MAYSSINASLGNIAINLGIYKGSEYIFTEKQQNSCMMRESHFKGLIAVVWNAEHYEHIGKPH